MTNTGTSSSIAISRPVEHCYIKLFITKSEGKLGPALSRASKSSKKDVSSESDTEPETEQDPGHTCLGMSRH